jgi:hypothetical protein
MPKTGGTFVTAVLMRIHPPPPRGRVRRRAELRFPRLVGRRSGPGRRSPLYDIEPKHGTCGDIPRAHRAKPILSTVRNPYDWYVSQYEFAWWKRAFVYHPEPYPTPVGAALEAVLPEFERVHPDFPDLCFAAFLDVCDRAADDASGMPGRFGLLTYGFVNYYFTSPDAVLPRMGPEYVASGRHRADMWDVRFLRMDRLSDDLSGYLTSRHYTPDEVAFIGGVGRVLPMGRGRDAGQPWQDYYTPELMRRVRERDRALFAMFPEYDE